MYCFSNLNTCKIPVFICFLANSLFKGMFIMADIPQIAVLIIIIITLFVLRYIQKLYIALQSKQKKEND